MKKVFGSLLVVFLGISCQHQSQDPSKITAQTTQIDTLISQDSAVIQTYAPYKKKMVDEINTVLSYAPHNLTKDDGTMQSTLGNLMADMMYDKADELFHKEFGKHVDFVLSNHGGIRASLWKGEVKALHAFNIMPFDNTLVVTELTKEKLEELFTYFVSKQRAHPLSKQVWISIEKTGKYQVRINGKPVEDRTYFVATSNYLQKGGDNMHFFADPVSLYDSNFLIRDAISEYFTKNDTIVSQLDERIQILNN
jgi:5'-nucleotidase